MYSNIVNTFWTMSKPCEHVFGYARSIIREYTVKVWGNIARKLSEHFHLIYENSFQAIREPRKGYVSLVIIGKDRNENNNKKEDQLTCLILVF